MIRVRKTYGGSLYSPFTLKMLPMSMQLSMDPTWLLTWVMAMGRMSRLPCNLLQVPCSHLLM